MLFMKTPRRGTALVMVLTLVLVFATASVALNELVSQQALELEYLMARVQADYAARSGLVYGQVNLTEDISTLFTRNPQELYRSKKAWCVEWFVSDTGVRACDTSIQADQYCCHFTGDICSEIPANGICQARSSWQTLYTVRYDSIDKTIISSGRVVFLPEDNPDLNPNDPVIEFTAGREMGLAWE